MYLDYWKMDCRPFGGGHAPRFFVNTGSAELALAKLRYACGSEMECAVLLGPAGCGKTEVGRILLAELEAAGWTTAMVLNPVGSGRDVLAAVAYNLGVAVHDGAGLLTVREALLGRLRELADARRSVCLFVDEAHTVSDPAVLEEMRMLLNAEYYGRPALTLILAGQEPLAGMLETASHFASRVALTIRMAPLSMEDSKKYILYRLKVAGCNRGIFTRHAADRIAEIARGVPRSINKLCDLALLTGYGLGEKKIGPDTIDMVAGELGLRAQPSAASSSVSTEIAADDILARTADGAGEEEVDILAQLAPSAEEK